MPVFTGPIMSGAECDQRDDYKIHNLNAGAWIDLTKYRLENVTFHIEGSSKYHKVELLRINKDNGDFQVKSSCWAGLGDGGYVTSGTVKFRCVLDCSEKKAESKSS